MPKVVFVVLHYLTYKDTIECVESIKNNINYENYKIVIVDNASNNGSFEIITNEYELEEKIFILSNKSNVGFAQGNNIGYQFAKETLKADFIIIINNDTIIRDSNFIEFIIDYHKRYGFHILGPKIISLQDQCNQNPLEIIVDNKRKVLKAILKYFILYIANIIKLEEMYKKIKKIQKVNEEKYILTKKQDESILKDVPLHGACLIFSKEYINNEKNAFYPNTFLFVEEDILYYICKKKKYNTVYYPKLTIFHKEDSSTNFLMNNENRKRRFIYKNILKSSIEFFKLMCKNDFD